MTNTLYPYTRLFRRRGPEARDVLRFAGLVEPVEARAVEVDGEVAEHPHDRRRLVADAAVAAGDDHSVAAVAHQLLEASLAALLVQRLRLCEGVEGEGGLGAAHAEGRRASVG